MSTMNRFCFVYRPIFALVAIATGVTFTTAALASGASTPEDSFVARQYSDVDSDRYEAGELGVILPSYSRLYLYPAWRAIVLGRQGVGANTTADGLRKAETSNSGSGWTPVNDAGTANVADSWIQASRDYAATNRIAIAQGSRQTANGYSSYTICPSPAFNFAMSTFTDLVKRKDATPERLRAWVLGQDQVFAFCDYDKTSKRGPNGGPTVRPQMPPPLPTNEPVYWQQLRKYQIAAAAFYADDFEESFKQFSAIGADKTHPMYAWGAYLALRAKARSADLDSEPGNVRAALRAELEKAEKSGDGSAKNQAQISDLKKKLEQQDDMVHAKELADLSAQVKRIVDDSSLATVHEASKATLRTMQARLAPMARFVELTAYMDDLNHNPYENDHFSDWYLLANDLVGSSDENAFEPEFRKKYAFFDWMRTIQRCGYSVENALWSDQKQAKAAKELCHAQYEHAVANWKTSSAAKKSGGENEANAWLVASMMLADSLTPELESAALRVKSDAPEYLTVRYDLTRLYRIKGDADKARQMSEEMLPIAKVRVPDSISTENLFKQERFATATSVNDAIAYLTRKPLRSGDDAASTQSKEPTPETPTRLGGDGVRWLNSQLGVQEMSGVAKDGRLPADLRSQIAVATWIRADLLHNVPAAHAAAKLLAQTVPQLKTAAEHYDSLNAPDDMQHALIVTMLEFNLHALVQSYAMTWPDKPNLESMRDDATASMWCHIPFEAGSVAADAANADNLEEHLPDPLTVSADPAARDREISALSQLKTATGFVGDHVMQWVKVHPKDPDAPWLLHVVVQSTRGGCLDADSSKLSRAAYSMLHSRYKTSDWTAKTRVWY